MKRGVLTFILIIVFFSLTGFVFAVTCTDSDGGDVYQKGTTKGANSSSNGTIVTEEDYCVLENDLSEKLDECEEYACGVNEWECTGEKGQQIINRDFKRCAYSCNDGKCLKYQSGDCDIYYPDAVLRDSTISFNEHKIVIYLWGGKEDNQYIILQIDGEQLEDKLSKDDSLEFKDIIVTVTHINDQDYSAGLCLEKGTCSDCGQEIENGNETEEETEEEIEEEKFFIQDKEIKFESNGTKIILQVGNLSIETSLNIIKENKKIYIQTSKNKTQIKILPEKAIETATKIEKIDEIKIEEYDGNVVYFIKGTKKAFLFFIFPAAAKVEQKIDVETAEIIFTKKPWWSFLALGV